MSDESMPPCCGSGCAVCVLDYWEKPVAAPSLCAVITEIPDASPVCCGTGCTVCVLDYSEPAAEQEWKRQRLVEAIEEADRSLQLPQGAIDDCRRS